MNRRELLIGLGTAASTLAVFGAGRVRADDKDSDHEGHEHDEAMHECADACAECAHECSSCAAHCLSRVASGKLEHLATQRLCSDCADICAAAAMVMSRGGPLAHTVCEACVKACETCAAACEKLAGDHHMEECAKACRACAKACREMLKAHKH